MTIQEAIKKLHLLQIEKFGFQNNITEYEKASPKIPLLICKDGWAISAQMGYYMWKHVFGYDDIGGTDIFNDTDWGWIDWGYPRKNGVADYSGCPFAYMHIVEDPFYDTWPELCDDCIEERADDFGQCESEDLDKWCDFHGGIDWEATAKQDLIDPNN